MCGYYNYLPFNFKFKFNFMSMILENYETLNTNLR